MTGAGGDELDQGLVLSDLLNHVLDKGVVLTGDVTISVADIDLVRVGLSVLLTSVESEERHVRARALDANGDSGSDADLPVLPPERGS